MSNTDPLTHGPAARLSLPFLPTLVTAVVLAAASLLCREPAAPPPAASVAPPAFHPALPVEAALPRASAMIAFAEQYPLRLAQAAPRVAAGPRPAARLAAVRRPCAGSQCSEAALRRPDPSAALARPEVVRATAEAAARTAPRGEAQVVAEAETTGGFLPGIALPGIALPGIVLPEVALPEVALPFAPVARVVGEAAGFLRAGAASVGGSLAVMVDRLR